MEHIFQHFRKEEREFIEQVYEWKQYVEDFYAPKTTPFLDPRQLKIVSSIIGMNGDVKFQASGGFLGDTERKRVVLYPSYMEPGEEDFQLVVLQAKFPSKFVQLKHPDILGALLGLGLERTKFGDIRIDGEIIQCVVAKEVADYVRVNLTAAGKSKISFDEVSPDRFIKGQVAPWTESVVTVSSLRLDTVIASCYPSVSRQKAALYIESGKVKVNYTLREQNAFELEESDLLSIRGLGRLVIHSIEGKTKKDKIRLKIGKIERK